MQLLQPCVGMGLARTSSILLLLLIVALAECGGAGEGKVAVTPELVQEAEVICRFHASNVAAEEGGLKMKVSYSRRWKHFMLKGLSSFRGMYIYVPGGKPEAFASRKDEWLLFARVDLDKRTLIPLMDGRAILPYSEGMGDKVAALVEKQRRIQVTVSADRESYKVDSPIALTWVIKNLSDQPTTILSSPGAFRLGYVINDRLHSGGGGRLHDRRKSSYTSLAGGEQHTYRKTINALAPEGSLPIRMGYVCKDNVYYTDEKPRQKRRMPGVEFVEYEKRFDVTVEPLGPDALQEAREDAGSGIWMKQLDAMRKLSCVKAADALPEVQSAAAHPSPAIRKYAAAALTINGKPISRELADLFYDPRVQVMKEVTFFCKQRRVPGSSIHALAAKLVTEEAVVKGVIPKTSGTSDMGHLVYKLREPRIGDIYASWLKAGKKEGALLASFVGLERQMRRKGGTWHSDEAARAPVLAKWQEVRAGVKDLWTEQDLEKERARCRKRAFNDLAFDPRFVELKTLLKQLTSTTSRDKELVAKGRASLAEMGPDFGPTVLFIMQAWRGHASFPACELLVEWKVDGTAPFLLELSKQGQPYAPILSVQLDRAAAEPQLLAMDQAMERKFGIKLALCSIGHKKFVPDLVANMDVYSQTFTRLVKKELRASTGQPFTTIAEWRKWWKEEGSKREWE